MIHTIELRHIVLDNKTNRDIYDKLKVSIYITSPKNMTYSFYHVNYFAGIDMECHVKRNIHEDDYSYYWIGIRLNPMELITNHRIHVLDEVDINMVRDKFNEIMSLLNNELDINLLDFDNWSINRVDYSSYFDTEYASEYMKLFNKSFCPKKMERTNYKDGSMYFTGKQRTDKGTNKKELLRYNFYDKSQQMDNDRDKKHDYSWFEKEQGKNYVRIEIQCNYDYVNNIRIKYGFSDRTVKNLLCGKIALEEVTKAFNQCICKGDFYPLRRAKSEIDKSNYGSKMKETLKNFIRDLRKYDNLDDAREDFIRKHNKSTATFDSYIKKLETVNINPVTLEDDFELKEVDPLASVDKREKMLSNPSNDIQYNIIAGSYFLDGDTETEWLEKGDIEIIRMYPLIYQDMPIEWKEKRRKELMESLGIEL